MSTLPHFTKSIAVLSLWYCKWHSTAVVAFTISCRGPANRCVLNHPSFSTTSQRATISSPSSKPWTGGYMPSDDIEKVEVTDDPDVALISIGLQEVIDMDHLAHAQTLTHETEIISTQPDVKTANIQVILPQLDHLVPTTHSNYHPTFTSPVQVQEIPQLIQQHNPDPEGPRIGFETSCVLTQEQIAPIFKFQKKSNGKVKLLNAFSLYTILVCVFTMPLWALSMYLVDAISRNFPDWDPHRATFDKTGKVWCKIYLTMTNSYPTISGDLQRLKEKTDPKDNASCLFVANHASFLDIAVLCTVLDPVFKFIAKSDLKSFPFIGNQLTGGQHILIDRNDRRSQLRAFKEGVSWLQKGVPLMAFPEGTRSKDGRLIDFKGGMFSMAVKSKVPIVPISISNTHAIFPSNALMPIQMGAGKLHVHVHPPIDVEGKSEEELASLVRTALLSKLPLDQHPLEGTDQSSTDNDDDDDD